MAQGQRALRQRKHGITYEPADPKDTLYLNFLPLLNSGKVRLLDNKRLVTQLIGLERNTSRAAIRLSAFECLLMALSGHSRPRSVCPLLGVKRTFLIRALVSDNDQKRNDFIINASRPLRDHRQN